MGFELRSAGHQRCLGSVWFAGSRGASIILCGLDLAAQAAIATRFLLCSRQSSMIRDTQLVSDHRKQINGQRRRSEIEATLRQGLQLRAERSAAGQFWTFTMSNSKASVSCASRIF